MKYKIEITSKDQIGGFECIVTIDAESLEDAMHEFNKMLRARKLAWNPKTVHEDEIESVWFSCSA